MRLYYKHISTRGRGGVEGMLIQEYFRHSEIASDVFPEQIVFWKHFSLKGSQD